MPEQDATAGANPIPHLPGVPYLEFLAHLHRHLGPQSYLEIGTSEGESLAAARCDAIAVDPQFALAGNAAAGRARTFLFQMPSDVFFRDTDVRRFFPNGVDLAFLDGMHRIEFLLRDFINTEASAHRRSLILVHDCLPLNARMARRSYMPGPAEEGQQAMSWTGDVWKIIPVLKEYRPDLRLMLLDCPPTGLLAISRIDPQSTSLDAAYHGIIDRYASISIDAYDLKRLWAELPLLDSRGLVSSPERLTAAFGVY
jgi:hypothetical protein